jgi:hypothetical protein
MPRQLGDFLDGRLVYEFPFTLGRIRAKRQARPLELLVFVHVVAPF